MIMQISPAQVGGLLIVGSINIWLLTTVGNTILFDRSAVVDKVEWSPNVPPLTAVANNRKAIDVYKQVLARPVFFKAREPYIAPPTLPPPVPKVVAPPPVIDPGFVLAGVMIKSGVKKVYISIRSNSDGIWAGEGDNLMGWKIQSVSETGVKLEQSGRVIEVQLYSDR